MDITYTTNNHALIKPLNIITFYPDLYDSGAPFLFFFSYLLIEYKVLRNYDRLKLLMLGWS